MLDGKEDDERPDPEGAPEGNLSIRGILVLKL